jgi:hypothetical protein
MKPYLQRKLLRFGLPLIVLLALTVVGSYFVRYPGVKVSPFEAVSKQSGLLIGASGSMRFLHDSLPPANFLFPGLLQRADLLQDWAAWRSFWRALGREQRSGLKLRQALLSLQPVSADQMGLLLLLDASSTGPLEQHLQSLNPRASRFRGHTLYQLPAGPGQGLSYTVFRNILLVSPHTFLLEEAIDQLRDYRQTLARASELERMRRRLPGNELALYLSPGTLPAQFSAWLASASGTEADWFRHTGQWVALSISRDSSRILYDGLFQPDPEHPLWANLQKQSPRNWKPMLSILPDHTAGLFWMGFNRSRHAAQSLEGSVSRSFSKLLLPLLDGELAWVQLETFGADASETIAMLLRVQKPETADQGFQNLAEQLGELHQYEYQTYLIRQISAGDLLPVPFQGTSQALQTPFCTRINDYLVFAGSRSALEVLIDKYIAGQTLENLELFQSLSHDLPAQMQSLIWIDWAAMQPRLQSMFRSPELPSQIFSDRSGRLLAGLLSERNGFVVRASREQAAATDHTNLRIAWKCALQAEAAMAPVQVPNGQGGFDYLIQDIENRLYRIQSNGQLIWKRPFDGRIQSDIHSIDYYGNGQVQYLFNTNRSIHLLDQEGQSVSTFPIQLQSPASNGVAVVDFGNFRDLAFFIACENGNVYGYNRTGIPLEGWRPKELGGRVLQPLRHFQHDNKDYLVLLEKTGRLSAYGRQGEPRFPSVLLEGSFLGRPEVQQLPRYPRIAVSDVHGKVHIINTQGQRFFLQMQQQPGAISEFALGQICGDERLDYISLAGTNLQIGYYDGDDFKTWQLLQLPFAYDEVFILPGLYGNTDGIGLLSIDKKRISLLSEQGELLPGLTLAGTTRFTAGQLPTDRSRMLVVAHEDAVYGYRY